MNGRPEGRGRGGAGARRGAAAGAEGPQGPAEAGDARFKRSAEAAAGTPGGAGRGAGCAPRRPCGEGQLPAARPAAPAAASGVRDEEPRRWGSGRPRAAGLGRRLLLGCGVCCLRGTSVGAGARGTRGPAGALGAEELRARGRAASSSCRTGPRRPAAAAETERGRRRRPGQPPARSGSGSCRCQLPVRPQRRQPQQHHSRQRG